MPTPSDLITKTYDLLEGHLSPLIKVLCRRGSNEKSTISFIYEEIDRAKEMIQSALKEVSKR